MAAPPLPQGPNESTADYFEYLLRWMPGTHGGLLCPQRFMYKDDDAFVAAVREWSEARRSGDKIVSYILLGFTIVAIIIVIILLVEMNL